MDNVKKTYLNRRLPGSFTGVEKFIKSRSKRLKYNDVKTELLKLKEYYRFFSAPKKFKRRKVVTHFPNWQLCTDLMDMRNLIKENKPFNYIIIFCDCFSRKVWAYPLSTKRPSHIVIALKKLFKDMGTTPKYIQSDQGTEFTSQVTQKFLRDNNITWFFTKSEVKASIYERVIGTFRQRMTRMFAHQKNHKWKHILKDIVRSYNSTYHTTIKQTPNYASKPENVEEIWNRLYKKYMEAPQQKHKYREGQKVRISVVKKHFEKGSTKRFDDTEYEIKTVRNTKPVTYILFDTDGVTPIDGGFYEKELLPVQ